MRVLAVLGEGISLERQVCSKIDYSGDEGSRHLGLLKTSEKKVSENIADRRFESCGLYYSFNVLRNRHFCPKPLNFETFSV